MFGTASSSYALAGLATGGPTMFVTVDANGNLATSTGSGGPFAVIDDLTTGGSTSALSANQGVILAGLTSAAQSVATSAAHTAAAAQSTANAAASTANGALQRTGGTMTGNINMNGHTITNVATPTTATDVANKGYVDAQLSGIGGEISSIKSDINSLHQRDSELADGIAISMAVAAPNFLPGQTFAVRVGWGNFDGSHAVGLSAAGLVAKNTFGQGSSVIVDGGIGAGTGSGVAAGRAGMTLGW
jgi:hypothetical protein